MVGCDPGARTHWHTHPLGQTLVVLAGCGRTRRAGEGGPIQEIRAGGVGWMPAEEEHKTAPARRTPAMTHLSIQEALNGSPVDWLEPVTDAQYRR